MSEGFGGSDGFNNGTEVSSPITDWINFNMVTGVVNHKTSGISGITDNGTGDFTINPTTAFPAVYGLLYGCSMIGGARRNGDVGIKDNNLANKTTALIRVQASVGSTSGSNAADYDLVDITISILGA